MSAPEQINMNPRRILFGSARRFPTIPSCEHIAGSVKFINKALELHKTIGPVFDITCDLEDGSPVGEEEAQAIRFAELVASQAQSTARIGVRVHDLLSNHWRRDLEIVISRAGAEVAYLTLPKVRTYQEVVMFAEAVQQTSIACGLSRIIPLHILIETTSALQQVYQIAGHPAVEVLDFGLLDFIAEHHGAIGEDAMRSPLQFEHALIRRAKSEIVAAALGHGVVPAHNISTVLDNPAAVEADARRAREEFGFLRMWSIHPSQIEPIVKGMRPSEVSIERAVKLLRAGEDAQWGPIRFEERLHDRASYRFYWQLLERAVAMGVEVPTEVRRWF